MLLLQKMKRSFHPSFDWLNHYLHADCIFILLLHFVLSARHPHWHNRAFYKLFLLSQILQEMFEAHFTDERTSS